MKRALLSATALIASSFTPVASGDLVSRASAALPTPNVLLCTDTKALGSENNGHFWGTPYILPVNHTDTFTFAGPYSGDAGEYFVVTQTTVTQAVFQRCRVMNWNSRETGKYQDVEVAQPETVISVYNCQSPLTEAGAVLGYVACPGIGSSGDTRKSVPHQ